MWVGRVTRRSAQIARLIMSLSTDSPVSCDRSVCTSFVSLAEFIHRPYRRAINQKASFVNLASRDTRIENPARYQSQAPERQSKCPENDADLHGRLLAIDKNRLPGTGGMKRLVAATLDVWKTREPRPQLSEETAALFLSAIAQSREATTFNGRAFVKEVVQEFGVMPTVRLYNCLLDLYVARKEPVANLLALLKQMKEKGVALNWGTCVAAISICTANKDSRTASKILKDMQQEELPDSELGEQQRRQLSSALLNLAVAASREGGIRDSVQFIKYTTALGQPPSLLMLQEALQTAVDHADSHAALDLLQLMEISAEKGGRKLVVDEGQCLSLLNCAASSESRRLAVAAWQLLKSSLAGGAPGGSGAPRWPVPACYHAYMHAMAVSRQIGPALEAAAELREAHPSLPHTWYRGLVPLVEAMSTNIVILDAAERALEDRLSQGRTVTSSMSDCIIAAAGNVRNMNRAFHTFDSFAELGVGPTTDSYSAVVWGCVRNGLLDSVPMILSEFQQRGLQPNEQLWAALVWFYITAREPEGVLRALSDMRADGHAPSIQLLDAAMARMEREGHEAGILWLLPQLQVANYRHRAARLKVNRWRTLGGIQRLTGTETFLPRHEIINRLLDQKAGAAAAAAGAGSER